MFIFVMIVLLGSAGLGYMIARGEPRIVEPEPTLGDVEAGANDARISSGAIVTWKYEYEMCRHCIQEKKPADVEMIGLSFSQFRENYPDLRVISFESDSLVVEKSFDCYCPDHYILKLNGENLAVYRTRLGTDEQEMYSSIDTRLDLIDPDKRSVLVAGRVFSTMGDLKDYVEKISTLAE